MKWIMALFCICLAGPVTALNCLKAHPQGTEWSAFLATFMALSPDAERDICASTENPDLNVWDPMHVHLNDSGQALFFRPGQTLSYLIRQDQRHGRLNQFLSARDLCPLSPAEFEAIRAVAERHDGAPLATHPWRHLAELGRAVTARGAVLYPKHTFYADGSISGYWVYIADRKDFANWLGMFTSDPTASLQDTSTFRLIYGERLSQEMNWPFDVPDCTFALS